MFYDRLQVTVSPVGGRHIVLAHSPVQGRILILIYLFSDYNLQQKMEIIDYNRNTR